MTRELAIGSLVGIVILAGFITIITLSLTLNVKHDKKLLLISIDGFRYNYLNSTEHPNLTSLMQTGVHGPLISIFPSLTFPNHYSIVTGLHAENHGIVGNNFYDPDLNKSFSFSNTNDSVNPEWWLGTPIWLVLSRYNIKSASCFWPGSEVADRHPTYHIPYNHDMSHEDRIDQVLSWIDLPYSEQPSFLSMYFSDVDSRGHTFGPDSDEVKQAIRVVDNSIGKLLDALDKRSNRIDFDIIIVSDHGMTKTLNPIFLDDFIDVQKYHIPELFTKCAHASIWAEYTEIPDLIEALKDIENATVVRKELLPERYFYKESNRTAPLHIIADEGYVLTTRENYVNYPGSFLGGDHGYDPIIQSMKGIFIGSGNSFVQNQEIPELNNTEIYNLIAAIMSVTPPDNNGTVPFLPGVLDPQKYKLPEPPSEPVSPIAQ